MKKEQLYIFKPIILLFLLMSGACIIAKLMHAVEYGVDPLVVFVANVLLFFIAVTGLLLQLMAMKTANPYAMVRGVMGSMIMKLFILGAATFIYLQRAGTNKSSTALFISMALYLVYTWIEVRIAMKLKPPSKHGGN